MALSQGLLSKIRQNKNPAFCLYSGDNKMARLRGFEPLAYGLEVLNNDITDFSQIQLTFTISKIIAKNNFFDLTVLSYFWLLFGTNSTLI